MIGTERREIVIYSENTEFNETQLQQIGTMIEGALLKHLDSFKANAVDMPKGENDVSKRIRQRAVIDGVERWITGETQQDIFDAYLRQAIHAGIVVPAQSAPTKQKKAHQFKAYARQWKAKTYDVERVRKPVETTSVSVLWSHGDGRNHSWYHTGLSER